MAVSSSQVSLKAVRQDLDLSAAGSMTERAVLNKVNKRSGPVSLSEFKGNVFGTQLVLHKNWGGLPWKQIRYESSGHLYEDRYGSDVFVSGNKIVVRVYENDDDNGMEARLLGKIEQSGSYRLTGKSFGRFSNYHTNTYLHVNLISNSSGYLSGTQNIDYRYEQNKYFAEGDKSYNTTVSLTTARPYITLVLRQINKYGGQLQTFDIDFWNWKLEKV